MVWSDKGDNTIGVSMRYLAEAVKWLTGLLEGAERDALLRPGAEMPHYLEDRRFTFPFRHKALWADCDRTAMRRYADDFAKIVKLLAQSNLASVRNGLDHKRVDAQFPNGDAMFACIARLREAFDVADVTRIYPKIFWLYKHSTHQGGTSEFEVKDYAGRVTRFFGPELAMGQPAVKFGEPFLVCPGSLLSVPNSEICFRFASWDEYTSYWQGYPRRRHIPPPGRQEPSDDVLGSDVRGKELMQLMADNEVVAITAETAPQQVLGTEANGRQRVGRKRDAAKGKQTRRR
jgi:hypothetical protein